MFVFSKGWIFSALLLASAEVLALCPIGASYIHVGNDANCDFADIQSAINAVTCHDTTILVSSEGGTLSYSGQHLEINGNSMVIEGTANACAGGGGGNNLVGKVTPDSAPPAPAVVLHGDGSDSVIYIHGDSIVTLESLTLTGGGGTYGGGVHFSGTGALYINDTTINFNNAQYGGGIQFNGNGGAASLTLEAGTIIDENTAFVNGGGIEIQNSARLFALQPYTFIGYNAAGGHGGGISVFQGGMIDIASPGYNGGPVLQFNNAAYGGGISVDGDQTSLQQVTIARVFSVDPDNPVQISGNTASQEGGAVYLKPFISGTADAVGDVSFCAFDFRIEDNIAQEGTALYADTDSSIGNGSLGGTIQLNGTDNCGPESPTAFGATPCAADAPCNTVSTNVAENSSDHPTSGSAILLQEAAHLSADRLVMRGNMGAHAVRTFDGDISVSNCLLADNTFSAERVRVESDGAPYTSIDSCTFVNNSVGAASVIYSASKLSFTNSIVDEPGVATLEFTASPSDLTVNYVLTNDDSTLPLGGTAVIEGEPTFVDAAHGDYHLRPTSLGVDFAPATGGYDLDRAPRDVDLIQVANYLGPRDIGAYERQSAFDGCGAGDSIFCNGFEPGQ